MHCGLCNHIMVNPEALFRIRVTESDTVREHDWMDLALHEKCFRKLAVISLRPLGFDAAEEPEVFIQLSKRERQRIPMSAAGSEKAGNDGRS